MKSIRTTIVSIALVTLLVAGIAVAAWTAPTAVPTGGNTYASINTSNFHQAKTGGLASNKFFVAGSNIVWSGPLNDGFILAKTLLTGSRGLFTHHVLVSGDQGRVKIGGVNSSTGLPLFDSDLHRTALTIDTDGRGSDLSASRAIDIISDNSCNNVNILANTSAVRYYSQVNGGNADIAARQVRFAGGDPDPGDVLISVNANGDAVWAKPKLVNGQIVFDKTTSPVTSALSCGTTVYGCTDPAANNYNANATDDDGSCTYDEEPEPTFCYQTKGNCPWNVSPYTTPPAPGCVRLEVNSAPYDMTCAENPTLPQEFVLWECPTTINGKTPVACPT